MRNKKIITAVLAVFAALLLAVTLAGCGPMLVTGKYRSWVGLYFLCTGPSWAPCIKGDIWRVSQAVYDQTPVGAYYNPW